MQLDRLGRRDGWTCWICGGETDRTVPPTAAGAPTIDHVLPRAHGGTSEPGNLRIAHRRCNGARGSRIPELAWPADLPVSLPADLLPVVRRRLRRPGESEVVALVAGAEDGDRAVAWLEHGVGAVFGGTDRVWRAECEDAPGLKRVRLRCDEVRMHGPVRAGGRHPSHDQQPLPSRRRSRR